MDAFYKPAENIGSDGNMPDQSGQNIELINLMKKYEDSLTEISRIQEKYEFIVNAYGEYMSLINRNYVYEAVNDAYCNAYNKTRADFIGKSAADVWGLEVFQKNIRPCLDNCFNGNVVKNETSFIFGNNQSRYYAVSYYPYKNKINEVTHVVVVTRDITDKKIAEIELVESEKKLRESNALKDGFLKIINRDLDKAYKYIYSLLPAPLSDGPVKTSWQITPCTQLGGDSFGYHWLDNENFAIYILDVSGHGAGAAMHSISALTMLKYRTLPATDFYDPADVLSTLNKTFQMADHSNLYFTMWYCVLNTRNLTLKYAGAAHPPIIIVNKNGLVQKVESENPVIGAMPSYTFRQDIIKIHPGSRIYLYSDGAYEIKFSEGNMMTVEDLVHFINQRDYEDGSEIQELYYYLKGISNGKLEDDFLMIKLRV